MQDGILQHMVRNTGSVARSARPAHPNGRPVALLNTLAVRQLVSGSSSKSAVFSTSPASISHNPDIDTSDSRTANSSTDAELLNNLAQAATQSGTSSALPEPDSSLNGGYYVTKHNPASGDSLKLAPIQRGKMYATFRKVPSPSISNRLPNIGSPARLPSPPVNSLLSSNGSHSPLSPRPHLLSTFELRKRSRSMLPSHQTISMNCPGTTTWAVASCSMHRSSAQGADSTTSDPVPSSGSVILPTEQHTVSRSETAALKLSLDQRRRVIELGRLRSLAATTKSLSKRHHTAFQKLLQTEQRKKLQSNVNLIDCGSTVSQTIPSDPDIPIESASTTELSTVAADQVDVILSVGVGSISPTIQEASCPNENSVDMRQSSISPRICGCDQIEQIQGSQDEPCSTDNIQISPFSEKHKSVSPEDFPTPYLLRDAPIVHLGSDSAPVDITNVGSASDQCNPRDTSSSNSGERGGFTELEDCSLNTHSDYWFPPVPCRSPGSNRFSVHATVPCSARAHQFSPTFSSHKLASEHAKRFHSLRSPSLHQEIPCCSTFANSLLRSSCKNRPASHTSKVDWLGTECNLEGPEQSLRPFRLDNDEVDGYLEDAHCGEVVEGDYAIDTWDSEGDIHLRTNYSLPLDCQSWLGRSYPPNSRYAASQLHPNRSHRRHQRRLLQEHRYSPPYSSYLPRRCPKRNINEGLMDPNDLDELNRNIADLQSDIRRLTILTASRVSEAESATERTLFPGQQTPLRLFNSTTSLGGSTRATWSDRPKLRDLATCPTSTTASDPTSQLPHASESSSLGTVFQAVVEKSPTSAAPSPGANHPQTHTVSSTTEVVPNLHDLSECESTKECRPEQKIFFVAFEESDPQRMQRKFDQLEARRAAEKTVVARLLEVRRSQASEVNGSADEGHRAHSMAKERMTLTLPLHRARKESLTCQSKNPYPVRPGATVLSCSEVNLPSAVARSRITPAVQHLVCKPVDKPESGIPLDGPRGSADGEAVDTSEGYEDGSSLCKSLLKSTNSSRISGVKPNGRLHPGLSFSSLHRLNTADLTGGCPTLSVAHSARPKLFVKPKAKSNRMVIVNAIGYACLAGAVNEPMKQATLKELAATEGTHFMILFRDSRCQYRAVYAFDLELEELRLICGTGPRRITHDMANKFFKYNSGGKHFTEITSTNHLSPVVDAITIHDSLWTKGGAQSAALNLLSNRL